MNTLELVKSRRSVRTFDGKAPDKETVMDIMFLPGRALL